jgi:filamentous hemagglutinin
VPFWLEPVIGPMQRHTGPKDLSGRSPDFEIAAGPNKGKTVDMMYTTGELRQGEIDGMNKFFEKNMTYVPAGKVTPEGQLQILNHLNKADIVAVDFRILDAQNQTLFTNFIKTLPVENRTKIIILR